MHVLRRARAAGEPVGEAEAVLLPGAGEETLEVLAVIAEQQRQPRQGDRGRGLSRRLAQPVEEAVLPGGVERIGPAPPLGIDLPQGAAGDLRPQHTVDRTAALIAVVLALLLPLAQDTRAGPPTRGAGV